MLAKIWNKLQVQCNKCKVWVFSAEISKAYLFQWKKSVSACAGVWMSNLSWQSIKLDMNFQEHMPNRYWGGVKVYLYYFFNLGATPDWVVIATTRPLCPRERDPVPVVQEVGWTPGRVWTSAEYLALTGIRSPDRQASSECALHRHKNR